MIDPVCIKGRAIACTPWGKAWCSNLEGYSDFDNRLPRGRRYARNGSVVDLQVTPGLIEAYVAGSDTYRTTISVGSVPKKQWQAICADCAGGIASLLELLRGKIDKAIMQRLCRQGDGLFPTPQQLRFSCSCPDGAAMCKHIAAALYGVGSRFDSKPELLFLLRDVDLDELIDSAGSGFTTVAASGDGAVLSDEEIGDIFGIELDDGSVPSPSPLVAAKRSAKRSPKADAKSGARKPVPQANGRDPYVRLHRQLAKAGSLTSAEAQRILHLSAAELRPLFKRLIVEEKATVSGKARGTTYHIRRD
ncbi:MAG: SWIM zinc finger family protein [Planctomycetota bacterium]|nr:SWIM zinc finger family protein [Planctomycetota bacterium]